MLADETWVLTGGAGEIARRVRPQLAARVRELRVLDRLPVDPVHPAERCRTVDLRDQPAIVEAMAGADGVLHLGGLSDEADFHDLAEINIVGTFHVLDAAREAGLRRVVYASSNRLTGFYPRSTLVTPDLPPRPDGLYGVSKVAGEALGRLYADKFGLGVVNVRIGSFEEAPADERQLSTWLSPDDALAAFTAAMTAPDVTFATFYAVSRNTRRWWDLEAGEALGFSPTDDAEAHADRVARDGPVSPDAPQAGPYAEPGFTLGRQRRPAR